MDRYKLYIFDWDGTLMDSINKIVHTLQSAAELTQLPIPSDLAVKNIIGASLTEAAQILFPAINDANVETFVQHYKYQYLHGNTTPSPMYDGIDSLLNNLRQADKLLAVATGKGRQGLDRVLDISKVGHLFHTTRSCDDAQSKPHPEMLQQILSELNVAPHEALMIGDSHFDLLMAKNAKVDRIGITHGVGNAEMLSKYQPKAIVDSLQQLEELIFRR